MGWEQRFREMVFAGGALAVTACGGSTSAQADAADSTTPDAGAGDDPSSDDAYSNLGPEFPCCNANPDPCCPMTCSGGVGPDAAIYINCEQKRAQCEAMSGFYEAQPDGSLGCTPTSAAGD